jgi:DNA invertase Pin-like site-specific DNA recombinase
LSTLAYSYIRLSTPEQALGDSVRRQLDATSRFAEQHGLQLDQSLRDIGKSAFRGKNSSGSEAALAHFLGMVADRRIPVGSYLIVESLDRLSRQRVEDAFDLLRRIVSAGIVVATLDNGQIYRSDSFDSMTSLLIALTSMMRAHEESKRKSERVAAAWQQKKLKAADKVVVTRRIPSWLNYKNGVIEADPNRAAVVRRIFELTRDGYGAYSIARQLNAEGFSAWSSRHRAVWRESFIKKMLTGRTVLGEYQPHRLHYENGRASRVPDGEPIAGYYPAVVDEQLYREARAAMAARRVTGRGRKGRGFANVFTGLLRCGLCGGGITFIDKGPSPKGGQYLRCSVAHAKAKRKCGARAWRYDLMEAALLSAMDELDVSYILAGRTKEAAREELVDELERAEDEIEFHRNRVERQEEAIASSARSVASLLPRLEEDRQKLQEATSRRNALLSQMHELDSFDAETRRKRLQELMDAIASTRSSAVETRRTLAAELRRTLEYIRITPEARVLWELLDQQPTWLEHYNDLTTEELSRVLDRSDFVFTFMYRNGREHLVDPLTRGSVQMQWSTRFQYFKQIAKLKGSVET